MDFFDFFLAYHTCSKIAKVGQAGPQGTCGFIEVGWLNTGKRGRMAHFSWWWIASQHPTSPSLFRKVGHSLRTAWSWVPNCTSDLDLNDPTIQRLLWNTARTWMVSSGNCRGTQLCRMEGRNLSHSWSHDWWWGKSFMWLMCWQRSLPSSWAHGFEAQPTAWATWSWSISTIGTNGRCHEWFLDGCVRPEISLELGNTSHCW